MSLTPPPNTRLPREAHRLDETKLAAWLAAHVEGIDANAITLRQFKGGQSNPTYWIGCGDVALVLRKKPPGKLLPSAHAVEREYRVMRALRDTDVPVPDALALCEDASVIGTPFFVMRWVPGRIFWDPALSELNGAPDPNAQRRAVYREYVRVLAALHAVDYARVGLGDYGKVGGFVPRQVERWSKQYEASRTEDVPSMNALMRYLAENVPANDETTLVHGDYRMDNIMFSADESAPKALALLDWELSTLGHPLSDLAYACMSYHLNVPGRGGLSGVDVASLGIPTEDELVAEYQSLTGRKVEGWPYFMAFGIFRLASILQGVYARSLQGNASSDDAHMYGVAVKILSELACSLAGVKV